MHKTNKTTIGQNVIFFEWKAAAVYLLILILVLVPYYNWFYRNIINFLSIVVFLISALVIFITLLRHIAKMRFKRALLTLVLGTIIVWTGFYAQDWRYKITIHIIKENYCDLSAPLEAEYLLGGIREIRIDNLPGRTGAFENSSNCIIVACKEEFYYCRASK